MHRCEMTEEQHAEHCSEESDHRDAQKIINDLRQRLSATEEDAFSSSVRYDWLSTHLININMVHIHCRAPLY